MISFWTVHNIDFKIVLLQFCFLGQKISFTFTLPEMCSDFCIKTITSNALILLHLIGLHTLCLAMAGQFPFEAYWCILSPPPPPRDGIHLLHVLQGFIQGFIMFCFACAWLYKYGFYPYANYLQKPMIPFKSVTAKKMYVAIT